MTLFVQPHVFSAILKKTNKVTTPEKKYTRVRSVFFFSVMLAVLFFAGSVKSVDAATIYSNSATGNDTTGAGTIGSPYQSFHKAYTSASANDTINLTGTFTWTDAIETGDASTGYAIAKNLTIQGQGAGQTIIQATSTDNTATSRLFRVGANTTATFKNLTMRNARLTTSSTGNCIDTQVTTAVVILDAVDMYNCRGTAGGNHGGAMYITGDAYINNSSIHDSSAVGDGGAISDGGSTSRIYISNSTIYSNTSSGTNNGGALVVRGSGSFISLINTTVTNNTGYNGGGVALPFAGSNFYMKNSIVANNVSGGGSGRDFYRPGGTNTFTSFGNNIAGSVAYANFASTTGDWMDVNNDGTYIKQSVGTTGTINFDAAAAINSNPLGTYTWGVLVGSIAIDNASSTGTSSGMTVPSTDQRGGTRSGVLDIGSFEYGATFPDVTAPVISSIATSTSFTTATITWSTNEAASSSISYGLTTSYGAVATSTGTTTHSVSLSGLTPGATYHYRVLAVDASGNIATSSNSTFVTPDNVSPVITLGATTTATSTATISWSTNENASSSIAYGTTLSYGTVATSTGTTSHSVNLSGLSQKTLYHYRVLSIDATGNISTSSDQTFLTTDDTPPVISLVASSTTNTTASISWTTDENSTSIVEYGTTLSYGTSYFSAVSTTTHVANLTGLSELTRYYFRVASVDASGNSATSTGYIFNTPDSTAPTISVVASTTASTTATITWTTNEHASSSVSYGFTPSYGTVATSTGTTTHSVNLSSLSSGLTYHFSIFARDATGNSTTTTDFTFATVDEVAPVISSIASSTGSSTALIGWNTNEYASSSISYGLTTSYGSIASSSAITGHSVNLSGLQDATTYHFRVIAIDLAGNISTSSDQTFLTTDGSTPVVNITSPASLVVVSGASVSIEATATDNISVSGVKFYLDGVLLGSEILTAPYTLTWNSTSVSDGIHTVLAVARDGQSNIATSSAVSFSVVNTVTQSSGTTPVVNAAPMNVPPTYGCNDSRAKNYDRFSAHMPSLCVYSTNANVLNPNTQGAGQGASGSVAFKRDLQLGSRGSDVKDLQKFLNKNGFVIAKTGAGSIGSETDQFGSLTKAALARFQKSRGVPSTGYFGPLTRKAIK